MEIKTVIFDLDGTLYDNRMLPACLIVANLFKLRLLSAERSVRKQLAGIYFHTPEALLDELYSRISASTGTPVEKVRAWYEKKYLPSQTRALKFFFHAKPWAKSALQELRDMGIKTVCFSDYGEVEGKLKAIGLGCEWFDLVIDSTSIGGLKPCRESFLAIADKIGSVPSEMLVIGDRLDTDGKGAAAAGMKFLLVGKKDGEPPDIKGEFGRK